MPRVTISIKDPERSLHQDLISLDLPPGLSIRDFKAFIEAETSVAPSAQLLYLNGARLERDDLSIDDVGIKDGEMLALLVRRPPAPPRPPPAGAAQAPSGAASMPPQTPAEVERLRQMLLADPDTLARVRLQKPLLSDTINDPRAFLQAYMANAVDESERQRRHQEEIALLNEDPFNTEKQRQIEERIRLERVLENAALAYENNPEVFTRVTMLYINVEINGHTVKALVDSGAQATVMSPTCAEACNIMRLVDRRYSGTLEGVGTAVMLGRVHYAEIKIGDAMLPCAFTVMEGRHIEMLFGLDMLRRHKARIDLVRNVLCLEDIEVPFVPEKEVPKWADADEPTIAGPDGTEIGARSGAIRPVGSTKAMGSSAPAAGPPPPGWGGSSAAGASTATPAAAGPSIDNEFPPATVEQLMSLGFPKLAVVRALRATSGNADHAATLLFSNMQD